MNTNTYMNPSDLPGVWQGAKLRITPKRDEEDDDENGIDYEDLPSFNFNEDDYDRAMFSDPLDAFDGDEELYNDWRL